MQVILQNNLYKSFSGGNYEWISTLQQIFATEETIESNIGYNKQRNRVDLLRKTKRSYFANMNKKIMKDKRKFRKTVNPLFSKKS